MTKSIIIFASNQDSLHTHEPIVVNTFEEAYDKMVKEFNETLEDSVDVYDCAIYDTSAWICFNSGYEFIWDIYKIEV